MSVAHIAKILKNAEKEWDRRRAEEPTDTLPYSIWHLMAERLLEAEHAVLACPVCEE